MVGVNAWDKHHSTSNSETFILAYIHVIIHSDIIGAALRTILQFYIATCRLFNDKTMILGLRECFKITIMPQLPLSAIYKRPN